jgi:hypothetical protein
MGTLRVKLIDWPGHVHECGGSGVLIERITGALTNALRRTRPTPSGKNVATIWAVGLCTTRWRSSLKMGHSTSRVEGSASDCHNSFRHKLMCVGICGEPRFGPVGLRLQ